MSTAKPQILIIENHLSIRKKIELSLQENFFTTFTNTVICAIELAQKTKYNLIILVNDGAQLSEFSHYNLLMRNPQTKWIPVLQVSTQEITSLCEKSMLKQKIQTLLRKAGDEKLNTIHLGKLRINWPNQEASYDGESLKLTTKELALLHFLASNSERILTRIEILKAVWQTTSKAPHQDRTIDTHIRALRKKVPLLSEKIISIYGMGYKLAR